jgi:hypothetical protein
MRVIIPTRAHLPRVRTHLLFDPDDLTFVVESEVARDRLCRILDREGYRIEISGIRNSDHGMSTISKIREWISQSLLGDGEWAILADDNIERLTKVSGEYYELERLGHRLWEHHSWDWRKIFNVAANPVALAAELRLKCKELGTIYGGLAAEENYFYRTTKWSRCSYTKTKFAVFKNDRSLSWVNFPTVIEDFVMTAQVIAKYGCVANNRYARAHSPYYEAGGIGSAEERRPLLEDTVAWLVSKYPGLVKQYKDQKHAATFAIHTEKSIEQWRKQHGYL